MATSIFDRNTWYAVIWAAGESEGDGGSQALQFSGGLSKNYQGFGYGSAFVSAYNVSDHTHAWYWQFFPSPTNSSQYILRPGTSNPLSWLSAVQRSDLGDQCTNCSPSVPAITNHTDFSSYWAVTPSGDGYTSYMSNDENGSDWYIAVNSSNAGDSSGSAPPSALNMGNASYPDKLSMQFQFSSVNLINDNAFSTLPPSFSAASSISSSGSSAQASLEPNPMDTGHYVNVGAAVGGAVGGIVLLVAAIVALLWFRRRKRSCDRNATLPNEAPLVEKDHLQEPSELPGASPNEAPAHHEILEAPGLPGTELAGDAISHATNSEIFELDGGDTRSELESAEAKTISNA